MKNEKKRTEERESRNKKRVDEKRRRIRLQ